VKTLYKLKDKSKVITSPLTFIATVNAIVASGFEPVFVDVNPDTFVIKPEEIAKAVRRQKDISVILPVHLMGYPANMLEINKIARKNNLIVIEDAAQAHGTRYIDKKLGTFSKLSCFSFYIAHNIQAGEMGAVATDDYDIFRLVKKLKAHGRMCDCSVCLRSDFLCPRMRAYKGEDDFDPRFYHDMFGFNFKTMEFQAALGISQLKRIKFILKKRSFNVRYLKYGVISFKGHIKDAFIFKGG
jgi:CDP-6-deoxy-D-xylo-4-hexulose-3-dehydrase